MGEGGDIPFPGFKTLNITNCSEDGLLVDVSAEINFLIP